MSCSKAPLALIALLLASGVSLAAGRLGKLGPVYPVSEPDMLEWIEARVRAKVESGEAERVQREAAKRIEAKLKNPEPLRSISTATANRSWHFDPTFTADEAVRDEKGGILVPAGTTVNPLDRVAMRRPMIFLDARDPNQVRFAKKFIDSRGGAALPVLVAGSYFDLMKEWGFAVYFDQKGRLVRKFGIAHVPAVVQQDGRRLRIDEIAL